MNPNDLPEGTGWLHIHPCEDDPYNHCIPNGEHNHIDHGIDCWCNPQILCTKPDGTLYPFPIISHRSQDFRELIEQAEAIKNHF